MQIALSYGKAVGRAEVY